MKTKEALKKELHELINSIDDDETLIELHEDIVPYLLKKNSSEEDEDDQYLTDEQLAELDEAIRQADNGEVISWEEFLNATQQWRKK